MIVVSIARQVRRACCTETLAKHQGGTGDERHVYVALSRMLGKEQFTRLWLVAVVAPQWAADIEKQPYFVADWLTTKQCNHVTGGFIFLTSKK